MCTTAFGKFPEGGFINRQFTGEPAGVTPARIAAYEKFENYYGLYNGGLNNGQLIIDN